MQGTDFIQTTKPDLLFRDVSLYTETISSPEQAPSVIHQAIASAYAGRGPTSLPQDVIAAKAEGEFSSVATLKPRPEFAASDEDSRSTPSDRQGGQRGDHVRGRMPRGAADVLRALSDRLKAPLIHSVKGRTSCRTMTPDGWAESHDRHQGRV
jgi:pyruvate dehydrogenase (quinone)